MLQFLMEDYSGEMSFPMELVFIQDGNALFHSLIYFLPTLQIDLYADSRSHGIQKKVYFSLLTHTTQIHLKFKKGVRVDVDSCSFWKDQKQEKLRVLCSWYTLNLTCCTIFKGKAHRI